MIILTPTSPKSVLVIAAHPDDIEFSFGGTAAKWANKGTEINYLLCTSGETGSHNLDMNPNRLAPIRQSEQKVAAGILGVHNIYFLDYPDGTLEHTLKLRKDLTKYIRLLCPEAVVTWDPTNRFGDDNYINHPDHLAVGEAALAAIMPTCDSPFIFPDLVNRGFEPYKVHQVYLFGAKDPNVWVDISETIEKKISSIKCHESQFDTDLDKISDYVRTTAQSRGSSQNMEYAEAFRYFHLR